MNCNLPDMAAKLAELEARVAQLEHPTAPATPAPDPPEGQPS